MRALPENAKLAPADDVHHPYARTVTVAVPHFELPISDPVLIVAVAMLAFLAVPLVFERLRLPGIVGLIVTGAAIGPHGFGIMERDQTIVLLGTVGLLYLMLLIGLELDLDEFRRYRNRSLVFGTLTFLVPGAAGTALAMALGYSLPSALLIGATFASHTLLAYPIASRLGILRNPAVTATLGGTLLAEVLALLLLAVVVESRGSGLGPAFWAGLAVPFAVYVAAVLLLLPRLARWFFRTVAHQGASAFAFVMAALFTVSWLAHFGRVEPIIGALLCGLALNRLIPEHGPLMSRIHFAGHALFIPFFLLSVGMLVDVRALDTARAWTVAIALAVGVVVSKWLASVLSGRVFRWSGDEAWVVFGLSVPHAAGTLAIVLVGFDVGLLDQAEVNSVVLLILATCIVGPWVVERYGRRVALAEEARPYDPSSAPWRVLVPVSNPATADALLDLAMIVRGRGSHEPLRPLMVVRGEEAEAELAEAERMLAHAVAHAAGAEVPAEPLTRVDPNFAAGIARGAAETRSTALVIGWDGRRSGSQAIFGTVLDQLLELTRQLVMVCRITAPINTTRRVVMVVPPGSDRHPGWQEAARLVHAVAAGVGASLATVAMEPDPGREAAGERVAVEGWQGLIAWLDANVRPDDLVVVMSARRDTVAWHPRLERVPAALAAMGRAGFIAVYPREAGDAGEAAEAVLEEGGEPERVA